MNIQEVEKHVKFDLIFTLLIFIGVGLCFLLSIVFIFKPTNVKAKEIINNVNISAKAYMPCGQTQVNGKYCAYTMDPTYSVRSVNTTYNGVLNGITFQFSDMLNSHAQYVMTIEAMSTDFRNNNLQVDVMASSQGDQLGTQISTYTWSYISKSKIQIIFMQDNYNFHTVVLTGYPLTGVNTYGIKKVTLSYDDGINDNSDIINSNTQNTNDIIDNNNSNTNDIINNQNTNTETTNNTIWETTHQIINQFYNMCNNLVDMTKLTLDSGVNAYDVSASSGSITIEATNEKGFWTDYIPITQGFDYYFNATRVGDGGYMFYAYEYDSEKTEITHYRTYDGKICQNQSACITVRTKYIRIHVVNYYSPVTRRFTGVRLNTNNGGYCPFGTETGNKLDQLDTDFWQMIDKQEETIQLQEEQRDIAQDQYDWLSDDTDPTVNTSDMNNVIGQVNIQDPLNYLLTLPINLLTKLNTVITAGTCSRASFGELYGTELYLPCINFENYLGSSLWGTIDTIVGIGLLAIIIKKFYDSISNILSLGKEEEVRKGMELPTPMEFLAQILGGGK